MRKVNFMSGINAKLVLAAMALGSFVLTGCEKEDFNVDVPSIKIDIPAAADGVVAVSLSATSENGNTLADVKFMAEDGTAIETYKEYKAAATFTVIASKDGYTTVSKVVNVPKATPGSFVVMPVNFVLTAMGEVEQKVGEPSKDLEPTSDKQSFKGTYEKGKSYTKSIAVPKGAYLTEEQRAELLDRIEKLDGPTKNDTRALTDAEANLETAKGMLRAAVNNIPDRENMGTDEVPVTFTPTVATDEVVFTVTTDWFSQEIMLTATVAEEAYIVKGEQTLAGSSKISAEGVAITHAHGVEIDHGHGHGGSTAGGGEGGK